MHVKRQSVHGFSEGHEGEATSNTNKGIPVDRPAMVDVRNAHLLYVITWFVRSFSMRRMAHLHLKGAHFQHLVLVPCLIIGRRAQNGV